jgi:hypothetical protein
MQRLHPMHLTESTNLPYRRVSAPATLTVPKAAATGALAKSFKKRRLLIFTDGFVICLFSSFQILPPPPRAGSLQKKEVKHLSLAPDPPRDAEGVNGDNMATTLIWIDY